MFWFNRSSQSLQPASKTINTMKVSIYQENTCQKYQHHIKVIIIVNELTRLTYDAIYLCFCYISGSSYKMWWDLVTSVHFEENINNIQQKNVQLRLWCSVAGDAAAADDFGANGGRCVCMFRMCIACSFLV